MDQILRSRVTFALTFLWGLFYLAVAYPSSGPKSQTDLYFAAIGIGIVGFGPVLLV